VSTTCVDTLFVQIEQQDLDNNRKPRVRLFTRQRVDPADGDGRNMPEPFMARNGDVAALEKRAARRKSGQYAPVTR
jgi:hypothetical protein